MNNIASMIDHTLLSPEASSEEIIKLCNEAIKYKFKSVCVNPSNVSLCKKTIMDEQVDIATVIGFPLGATTSNTKAFEAKEAIVNGATELDMVINIGQLKSGNYDYVREDIKSVVVEAKDKALVKVIIETCLLNDEEIVMACKLAKEAGADFVKTSTGFSKGGATVHDVRLMKDTVGDTMEVKASGGIRDRKTALEMIEAGATRLGASAGIKIIEK